MISALAAAALFYLLPLAAGASLLGLAGARRRLPDVWITGALGLTAWLAAVNLAAGPLGLGPEPRRGLLVLGATAAAAPAVLELVRRRATLIARFDFGLAAAAATLAGLGTAIWRFDSPYPSLLNWDLLEHLTLSDQMLRGEFHLSLRAYSDTFTLDTYLPFYHALLTYPRLLLAPDPSGYAWSLDTVHHLASVAAAGFAARRLLGSRVAAAWAMVIAAFTFESYVAYTALFHMPQTLTAIFFTVALGCLATTGPAPPTTAAVARWAVFLAVSHFFVAALAAPLLIGFALATRVEAGRARRAAALVAAAAVTVLAAMLIVRHVFALPLDPFGSTESAHFTVKLEDTLQLLRRSHGYALLLLLPLGAFLLARANALSASVAAATIVTLAAVLAPLPYVLKFGTLFHFLGAVTMAAGLARLLARAGGPGVAAWLVAWLAVFGLGQAAAFKRQPYRGLHSLVSAAERDAAAFLQARFAGSTRTLLVSDPATQHILEGLSGMNTQGGTFATPGTREQVDRMWPDADPAAVAAAALGVRDRLAAAAPERVVVAVGGRFFAWQAAPPELRRESYFNVWRPRDLDPAGRLEIERWCASGHFRRLFQNDGLALLEVVQAE